MSALPADALTCGSDIRPPRGGAAVIPLHGRSGARGGTPRATPVVPLRLTRRGRVLVAAVAALLVTVMSLLASAAAQATNHATSPHAVRQNLVQVVVGPGQSLWSVAESADPDQDTRAVIQQIIELNSLSGDTVLAGQQLWVPRG